jgi:hypothetical protein
MAKNRQQHTSDQIDSFLVELKKQTDRGAALIAGAVLDEILEMAISARLINVGSDRHDALFGRTRPLDSLSAKIELAYALGVFENAFRIQLDIIRDVRNAFAHRIEAIDFEHPDVTKILNRTRLKDMPIGITAREHFLGLFATLGGLLYGILTTDIRIKPISETHDDHLQMIVETSLEMQASIRKKQMPTQGSSEGKDEAKS